MASLKPYTITVTAEPGELLTVEQYATLPDEPGWKTELEEGKVIRMPLASFEHGRIVFRLVTHVGGYALAHELGEGTTEQSGYDFAKMGKVRVRAPDFAFLSHERLALASGVQYPQIAPDLVAEVVSSTPVSPNIWIAGCWSRRGRSSRGISPGGAGAGRSPGVPARQSRVVGCATCV